MQDTEEWDDPREMESQACGNLSHVLDNGVGTCADASRCFIDITDDSPQPQKHQKKKKTVVELASSDDDVDMDFTISRGKQHTPKSMVTDSFYFIIINSFIC